MLKLRWPELVNPWNPQAGEMLRREGTESWRLSNHTPGTATSRLYDEIAEHATRALDLERQWVKCQRFLRLGENVALAANLAKVASQEIHRTAIKHCWPARRRRCAAHDVR